MQNHRFERHLVVDREDVEVLLGAVGSVIDSRADDPDALAFTDRLHNLETNLIRLRVSIRNEMEGVEK